MTHKPHFRHLKPPYTFRGRTTALLLSASLLASIISIIFAFVFSHLSLLQELRLKERALALYLLEIEQRTELNIEELFSMMDQEGLTVSELDAEETAMLSSAVQYELRRSGIVSLMYTGQQPVTYVQTSSGTLQIATIGSSHSYGVAFARIIFASSSFFAVFALMVTLVSYWISKPVHMLTRATRRVQEGDFSIKLEASHVPGEMGELMRSFNGMTEALSQTSYLQKDFISSISHEFKTPIASIRGFARLLQMPGLTPEQQQEYIGLIAQESDRLSRLSQTLLRLSALEQQTAPASLTEFSLDEQIRQVILRLEPTWSVKDIDWQLDLSNVSVTSDQELLSHVWSNIIQNAIKFSPEGSTIEVRVQAEETAVVEITDHGIGMDEKTLNRIFDRFYQADRSRAQEGVGLGLCLVKRILDMLSGTVKVTSTLGEGSSFRICIPFRVKHTALQAEEKEVKTHDDRSSSAAAGQ